MGNAAPGGRPFAICAAEQGASDRPRWLDGEVAAAVGASSPELEGRAPGKRVGVRSPQRRQGEGSGTHLGRHVCRNIAIAEPGHVAYASRGGGADSTSPGRDAPAPRHWDSKAMGQGDGELPGQDAMVSASYHASAQFLEDFYGHEAYASPILSRTCAS